MPSKHGAPWDQEILRLEGYILTRDFACKILELLARRKSRAPVILVGESAWAEDVGSVVGALQVGCEWFF
jgi:hypothetical protein